MKVNADFNNSITIVHYAKLRIRTFANSHLHKKYSYVFMPTDTIFWNNDLSINTILVTSILYFMTVDRKMCGDLSNDSTANVLKTLFRCIIQQNKVKKTNDHGRNAGKIFFLGKIGNWHGYAN